MYRDDISTRSDVLSKSVTNVRSMQMAAETGEPYECVKEEAVSILEEMSQNLQLSFIRLMGFALSKVFKRLFSSIRVNEDGLTRVRHVPLAIILKAFLCVSSRTIRLCLRSVVSMRCNVFF